MRISRRAFVASAAAAIAAPHVPRAQAVTLDFPSWQAEEPGVSQWWREVIAAFQAANPSVRINFFSIPFVSYIQQLTVRFAGNRPPDIVHLPARNFASFASQGWLAPL